MYGEAGGAAGEIEVGGAEDNEGREGSEKEDTERHKVAERQGVEDAWKEGRRSKEEDSGSLERKREEEDSLTESGVLGWELWSGMRQGEGGGCKERFEGLEGRGEGIRRMKERRSEEREGNRENNEKKEKERVRGTVMAMVKGGGRERGNMMML